MYLECIQNVYPENAYEYYLLAIYSECLSAYHSEYAPPQTFGLELGVLCFAA